MTKESMARTDCATLLTLRIHSETDIVAARQRTQEVAALVGLSRPDQVALATAVSEIARNAVMYAGSAGVDFELDLASRPQFLWVRVTDKGPGIRDINDVLTGGLPSQSGSAGGIACARRLTDKFEIASPPGRGTAVRFGKALPGHARLFDAAAARRAFARLAETPLPKSYDAARQQNQDLIETLDSLRAREWELETRRVELERLNVELQETNRGVVALYAELEERATELRRADLLKSQFLSYVSHEFRTPVNSVIALTHLLLRRTDGDLTPEQEKQVTLIRQAVGGLVEMVNDLLDLAKVGSGKTEARNSTVEVGQVLGAVRALMRPLATNEAVNLVFEECVPGRIIETDEAKLGQILRNLVSNALKFTEKGEVRVRINDAPETQELVFFVEDTGIGIAPEDREVIFQEFSQINHSIQGRVKGTGLGLPLSRKLAELLGGTLTVSSAVGVGSTFILTLPYNVTKPKTTETAPPATEDSAEPLILIVDDEEASRYVCQRMFRGGRYRFIEADSREAAERARFELPQLIVLDLMMPGRSGFKVLDELKSETATRDIPVVIHTSKRLTDADLARLAGRHLGVLSKAGENRKDVLTAIRQVLGDENLFADEPEFSQPSKIGGEAQ
jgi:signal transduction histidine kinase/ActR/RegA family two-component response regulator